MSHSSTLFACCITLFVVKPVISQARTVITSFIEEYASEEEDWDRFQNIQKNF